MRAECPLLALSRHHFFRDVLRVARFVLRIGFFTAVFRPRAVLSRGLSDLMTASTAAWAAAVPAAVAALTATFCIRAALDLAAPTIVRWVFRTKLFLAIDVLRGASAISQRLGTRLKMRQRLFSFRYISETFDLPGVLDTAQRRTLQWQRR